MGAAKSSPRATIQAPKPMPEEDACQTGMEVLGGCHGMDRGLMGISLSLGEGSTYHPWDPGPDVGPTSVVLHKPKKERSSSLALRCPARYGITRQGARRKKERPSSMRHEGEQGKARRRRQGKTRQGIEKNRQPRDKDPACHPGRKTGGNQQLK